LPLVLACVVASTVAPKVMATASEGANPRQTRVTRTSAGPIFGATVHLALAGIAAVAVVGAADPVVGCVVRTDDGPEDLDAAGWSALGDAQPEPAREATKTTVAMTGLVAWRRPQHP
jgi:hypothetical protein